MTRVPILAAAALLCCLATAAHAETPRGDAAAGRIKAYTCGGCHGITGWKNAYPNYHVPRIGGQNYDYIVQALTEYKEGERAHPTMRAQGESLTDQDIRDVAAFISGITP
jgi:cytochrome c553